MERPADEPSPACEWRWPDYRAGVLSLSTRSPSNRALLACELGKFSRRGSIPTGSDIGSPVRAADAVQSRSGGRSLTVPKNRRHTTYHVGDCKIELSSRENTRERGGGQQALSRRQAFSAEASRPWPELPAPTPPPAATP